MLTRFFEGPPLRNFCLKISPLSRNSFLAERKRPGREEVLCTCIENISPANHIDYISLVYCNIAPPCMSTVTLPPYWLRQASPLCTSRRISNLHNSDFDYTPHPLPLSNTSFGNCGSLYYKLCPSTHSKPACTRQ